MKTLPLIATIALASCLWLLSPSDGYAQAGEPMIYTVGLTAEADGQHWAYLHWRTTAFDLFEPRVWSVWRKEGLPNDPGSYTLDSVVQIQTQPSVISGLIHRANLVLDEDTPALRQALDAMFEELVPAGDLTTAELASAVIQGVALEPQFLDSLQVVMRTFPSMAMALGTAHAVQIPSSGPVTFEIRYRSSLTAPDEGVVGRVVVDATNPLVLPPPQTVTIAPPNPDRPATGDLTVPLRWDTPEELRRLSLAQHGFNVYRVPRDFAELNNWDAVPPPTEDIELLTAIPESGVARINRVPAFGTVPLTAPEAAAADHTVIFITDEQTRFDGYPHSHTPPENGDQYYYFVSARDLLGRNGALSPGVLGTFCSRLPPKVPVITVVENVFDYDGGSPTHHLEVIWKANPPEDEKTTTAYALYRWETTGEMYEFGGNPANNLIAIVPHVEGPATLSYVDDGPGSPSAPADYTKTFWYTVRAIDDSALDSEGNPLPACAVAPFDGNVSGNSPPRWGVLRDRIGPGTPGGVVRIRCAEPEIEIDRETRLVRDPEQSLSPTQVHLEFLVQRFTADPNLAWVELEWGVGGPFLPIGRFEFEAGELELRHRMAFPAAAGGAQIIVRARAATTGDAVAESEPLTVTLPQPESGEYREVTVIAGVTYTPETVDRDGVRRPCFGNSRLPPDHPDASTDGIDFELNLPQGTAQYKLYYRIDNGPLTLLKEDSGEFDPNIPVNFLWQSLPVHALNVCFFLQAFDIHGNPSPLAPLGCTAFNFSLGIPKPMLAQILSGGSEGAETAKIQWFCPKWGLERFEVWIHGSPMPPNDLSPDLLFNGAATVGGVTYKKYLTDLIGPSFGQGSVFNIELPIDTEIEWRVRVRGVTPSGAKGKRSNQEEFTWSPPEIETGPDVPWPARPLPGSSDASGFNSKIVATQGPEGGGMVRIGETTGRVQRSSQVEAWTVAAISGPQPTNPLELVYPGVIDGDDRKVLPMVLYRVQRPNGDWPDVPGDVVQVSPLMETIAHTSQGGQLFIYDPFIHFELGTGTPSAPMHMFLLDTQPAVRGAMFRYYLVLFDPQTREIAEILVSNDVQL